MSFHTVFRWNSGSPLCKGRRLRSKRTGDKYLRTLDVLVGGSAQLSPINGVNAFKFDLQVVPVCVVGIVFFLSFFL